MKKARAGTEERGGKLKLMRKSPEKKKINSRQIILRLQGPSMMSEIRESIRLWRTDTQTYTLEQAKMHRTVDGEWEDKKGEEEKKKRQSDIFC
jgi:hypothetical protein